MSFLNNPMTTVGFQNPFSAWQREMNDLFDRFNRGVDLSRTTPLSITPNVEMTESDKAYQVFLEVPGMKEGDLNVSLKDNELIVEGIRKQSAETKNAESCSSEFLYGDIYRSIPLEEEVNPNTVKASYRDGILTVALEKLAPGHQKVKKIPIVKS